MAAFRMYLHGRFCEFVFMPLIGSNFIC